MRRDVLSRNKCVVMHGLGFIGSSSAAFLQSRGVRVVGVDPDKLKICAALDGSCPVPQLEPWLATAGAPVRSMDAFDCLDRSWASRDSIAVHHVAVPTEAEGAASDDALNLVMGTIAGFDKTAKVIIESTVSPVYIDGIRKFAPGLEIAVAPRRDWFDSPEKNLATIPRIFGADSPDLADEIESYLRIVCNDVRRAASAAEAALTKVIENGIRQIELAYINELALKIGDRYDIRNVLELAGTKWNIGLFHPSIGVGGYCLPLAPKYLELLDRDLVMTNAAMRVSNYHIIAVEKRLAEFESVDFWSISYKATAPFTSSSPAAWIAKGLNGAGVNVRIFPRDESERSWSEKNGIAVAELGARPARVLVIPVAHPKAVALTGEEVVTKIAKYEVVFDNENVLAKFDASIWKESGTEIRVPGRKGWLA